MKRQQKSTESREEYLRAAARYCRRKLTEEVENDPHCHISHNVDRAFRLTEERFADLGTLGVEGDCRLNGEGHIDIQYLNTGDCYDRTIVYYCNRLRVASVGDILEQVAARGEQGGEA